MSFDLLVGIDGPDLFADGTVDRRECAVGANKNFRIHLHVERVRNVDCRLYGLAEAVVSDVRDDAYDLKRLADAGGEDAKRSVLEVGNAKRLTDRTAIGPVEARHRFVDNRDR